MAGSYRTADATVGAHSALAVTPSNVTVLPTTRALYVGGGGDIVVTMAEDQTIITFVAVPGGSILPVQVTQVRAGTTATSIVALN